MPIKHAYKSRSKKNKSHYALKTSRAESRNHLKLLMSIMVTQVNDKKKLRLHKLSLCPAYIWAKAPHFFISDLKTIH